MAEPTITLAAVASSGLTEFLVGLLSGLRVVTGTSGDEARDEGAK